MVSLPTREEPPPLVASSPAGDRILEIDRQGRAELPPSILRGLKLFRPESFLAVAGGRQFIHLVRAGAGPPALMKSERISLLGEIEDLGIADVFSMLNMGRQSGMLLVLDDSDFKAVHFRRGEIVFAESSRGDDRLGQVLYRTGKLHREGLAEAEASLVAGRRFGAILLERGLIAPSDLQWGIKYQLEEIVYSIFRLTRGRFVFLRGSYVDADLATFAIDTNGVLMEAYQRVDELGLITAHIRGRDSVLRPTGLRAAASPLPDRLQRALHWVDGRRRVEEIVRALGWGEFNTFKVLYELLRRGLVEAEGAAAAPAEASDSPFVEAMRAQVDCYNRAALLVRDVLRAKRVDFEMASVFERFCRAAAEPARAVFQGVSLRASLRLSADHLLDNVQLEREAEGEGAGERSAGEPGHLQRVRDLLLAALDEWLAHLRLLIFNLLPAAEAEELASYVAAILRGPGS